METSWMPRLPDNDSDTTAGRRHAHPSSFSNADKIRIRIWLQLYRQRLNYDRLRTLEGGPFKPDFGLSGIFRSVLFIQDFSSYNAFVDNVTRIERSKQMSLVRSKNTKPEMLVRRLVHSMGYRYRLHQTDLPGRPDLVFRSERKVIFVHGCFWHRHKCKLGRMPKSRLEYWMPKIIGNKKRDEKTLRRLRRMHWRVLVLWECQLNNLDAMSQRIQKFLN